MSLSIREEMFKCGSAGGEEDLRRGAGLSMSAWSELLLGILGSGDWAPLTLQTHTGQISIDS